MYGAGARQPQQHTREQRQDERAKVVMRNSHFQRDAKRKLQNYTDIRGLRAKQKIFGGGRVCVAIFVLKFFTIQPTIPTGNAIIVGGFVLVSSTSDEKSMCQKKRTLLHTSQRASEC